MFFEPVGIFIAILLATGLAFFFEEKANKAFSILNQVDDEELVEVIRNYNTTNIPKREVVVGDIVLLNTGANIPADGELLNAVSLSVDESTLRRTHLQEEYKARRVRQRCHLPHQPRSAWHESNGGHGVFRVTRVGDATENGKVFTAAQIDNM